MSNNGFMKAAVNSNAQFINITTDAIQHECIAIEQQTEALENMYAAILKHTNKSKKNIDIKNKLQELLNISAIQFKFITKRRICAVDNPCNNCDECDECNTLSKQFESEKRDVDNVNQHILEMALVHSTSNMHIDSDDEIKFDLE